MIFFVINAAKILFFELRPKECLNCDIIKGEEVATCQEFR